MALTSSNSTFSGGISVGNFASLQVGASSTGPAGSPASGPSGVGTVMLDSGSDLSTVDSTWYTIANDITLCGEGTVYLFQTNHSDAMLTLTGMISGSSRLFVGYLDSDYSSILSLTSGCSTFSGGISVQEGYNSIRVGASSTGSPGDLSAGPLGTRILMLSNENDLSTTSSSCYTIGNAITLCGGGIVYLLSGSNTDTMLTLTGMISGASALDVGGNEYNNCLALTSACSTFTGGVRVESDTTLAVGASSTASEGIVSRGPLGTGTLMLSDGSNFTTTGGGCYTIGNNITLCGGTVTLLGGSEGTMLELDGTISGSSGLVVAAAGDGTNRVTLTGCNTFSGGTTVNSGVLTVGSNTGLGTGSVTANSSTLNFTSSSPIINSLSLMCGSTINFAAGSTPSIIGLASDTISSNNTIFLGDGSNTALTIQLTENPAYYGTISGAGSLIVSSGSPATLDLEGTNTYTGGTTVNSNVVLIAGNSSALGTGPLTLNSGSVFGLAPAATNLTNQITVENGADIGGYGMMAPASPDTITIAGGSGITGGRGTLPAVGSSPPSIIGTLSFGPNASIEFGSGGGMQFSLTDASGTPGVGYSTINLGGTLSITANSGDPFTIQLVGVDSTGQNVGVPSNFNSSQTYQWMLLSAASITGFTGSNQFSVDSSTYFPNPAGQFFVTDVGNDLMLNFTPVPEPSTWALMGSGLCALVAAVRRRRR